MENPFEAIENRLIRIEYLLLEIIGKPKEIIYDEDLLISKEVLDLLRIKYTTLWRWQKQGRIKVYKVGKINYYKRSEIMDMLLISK